MIPIQSCVDTFKFTYNYILYSIYNYIQFISSYKSFCHVYLKSLIPGHEGCSPLVTPCILHDTQCTMKLKVGPIEKILHDWRNGLKRAKNRAVYAQLKENLEKHIVLCKHNTICFIVHTLYVPYSLYNALYSGDTILNL